MRGLDDAWRNLPGNARALESEDAKLTEDWEVTYT